METIKFEVTVLIASEGKEIYKISEPSIYGKIIILGNNDSVESWAERDETIIEEKLNDL